MRTSSLTLLGTLLLSTALPVAADWNEGVAAFSAKNFEGAVTEFRAVVQQNPEAAQAHYMLGLSLEMLKRKEEALHHLRKAYDLKPNEVSFTFALGRAYSNMSRYGEAAGLLDTVDTSPLGLKQQVGLFQIRGQAKLKSGDTEGAARDFGELAKRQPQDAQMQYMYGTTALSVGQLDAAVVALRQASRLAPQHTEMKQTFAQALIKKARTSRDKTTKKEAYRESAALAGELVGANGSYGNYMLKMKAELGAGAYAEAIETGKVASQLESADWSTHFYLGQAFTSNQQYQEAVDSLQRAQSMAPSGRDQERVWKQLGFVYEKLKDYQLAIEAYRQSGDSAGLERATTNERTAQGGVTAQTIEAMQREAEALEAELEALEGEGGG